MRHNFRDSLRVEAENSGNLFWADIYSRCFGSIRIELVTDPGMQKLGVDRLVHFPDGRMLQIQEKFRQTDYGGDILLEYWSDKERRLPGWIAQDSAADFLTYNVANKYAYVFSWPRLRSAWKRCHKRFVNEGRKIVAQNHGYTTHSVALPVHWITGQCGEHWLVNARTYLPHECHMIPAPGSPGGGRIDNR